MVPVIKCTLRKFASFLFLRKAQSIVQEEHRAGFLLWTGLGTAWNLKHIELVHSSLQSYF